MRAALVNWPGRLLRCRPRLIEQRVEGPDINRPDEAMVEAGSSEPLIDVSPRARDADQGDSFAPRVVPDESRQLVCILSKEVDRRDDDVRPEPAPDLQRLDPIVGDASLVPEEFEELVEGVRSMPAVVDVQDAEPAC
jgi:hypothetical protein